MIVFRPEAKTPTFHASSGYEFDRATLPLTPDMEERRTRTTTTCGQVLHLVHWVSKPVAPYRQVIVEQVDRSFSWMRFDNASAIGRPCRRCFSGGEPR